MGTAELIAGGTFVVVAAMVILPYLLLVLRPEMASQEMLRQRIKTGGAAVRVRAAGASLLKDEARLSVIGPLNDLLAGRNAVAANLRDLVHMSGVKVTPGQIVLGSACLALFGYIATVTAVPSPVFGIFVALFLGAAPYAVLRLMRARRLGVFEEQFPEAVDLIARTLRAGHAFTTGLKMAADELPQPVAAEFKLLYDQQNYGLPLPDALHAFAKRVPLIDARFFVTAVLTQRDAGGNLSEVLDNLASVIRERFKVKRQIRVVTAHARITGWVLALLPPSLGLVLTLLAPGHMSLLWTDPTGIKMVVVALILQVVGTLIIRKMVDVEY